ncbi:hypothetical protein HA402_005048 [Bradysia odoriphaga]|nr:hypothetical protein HA402_005048 [Bradysia odoriphaga]
MNSEEFRTQGKKVIDFICETRNNVSAKRVTPGKECKVNFMKKLLPNDVPLEGESFDAIFNDFKEHIMPYCVYFNHPKFHAYFPAGDSYASLLGDMLSTASNQVGFSYGSSPAITEHEQLVMNMYAKSLGLPDFFIYDENNPGTGGGAMQGSASDCIMLALLTARARAVKILKGEHKSMHESVFLPQMVAYTSEEAHSSVEKAAKICIIRLRKLPTDEHGVLRGDVLAKAIEHDVNVEGFIPIFVSVTAGTTGTCAFDRFDEIGPVCKKYETIWFHVDGAYGGSSFILPEMVNFKRGLEYADSFNTNPNKLLLTAFDASCFWVKSVHDLKEAMTVDPTYLKKGENDGEDLRHFGVPLSRRFRSLKLWCVLRNYGINGLQAYIRNHIEKAKYFESLVRADKSYSIVTKVQLGLACFRLLVPNATNDQLDKVNMEFIHRMNESGEIHLTPTHFKDNYVIRFCVAKENATNEEIDRSWLTIQRFGAKILEDYKKGELNFQKIGTVAFESRFAFTRSVSRKDYDEHKSKVRYLKDGATNTLVCDD